ncbi:MAG: ParB/RepB/Spo0J family partition protein [Methylococcales bacterium]|nr:ParB/RepB/Spo0J family partition protein [Methylococcales bacterium]
MKKKTITVSGLVETGAIQDNLPTSLPRFKGQSEFSNNIATNVPLDQIIPNPYQPRRIFPEDEILELSTSISEIGLIQPIAVRKINESLFQIIAGERRFRAFKRLELLDIPCFLFACSDADMAVMAIAENVNREDLSDYEISKSIRNVENQFPSRTKLAEALGFQREDMYRYFAYDSLPGFVIEKLEINPRLLSRNAASDIKRVFNKTSQEHYGAALLALQEGIYLLEKEELDQTKIANFISLKVKHFSDGGVLGLNRAKEEFFINGKKIGHFSSSDKGVTIKISTGILNDERTEELRTILNNFLIPTQIDGTEPVPEQ